MRALLSMLILLPGCYCAHRVDRFTFGDVDAATGDAGSDAATPDVDAGPDAGADAGPQCTVLCGGATPICDAANDRCVECTDSALHCDDGEPCTVDRCGDGACTHSPEEACIIQVEAGTEHTCARRVSGETLCWGWNFDGQLGVGTSGMGTDELSPRVLPSGARFGPLAAGTSHTCARSLDLVATRCWGSDQFGQLGSGGAVPGMRRTSTVTATNVAVAGVVAIDSGTNFTCALLDSRRVVCWGADSVGQLGNGTDAGAPQSSPVEVVGIDDAVDLVAGGYSEHACVRRADASVWCWGSNEGGELGNGMSGPGVFAAAPVEVVALPDATEVAAGGQMTCAVHASGSVSCWGTNTAGLGNGAATSSAVPVSVSGLVDATEVVVGGGHACARRSTGEVWCWGQNRDGQLGDGTRASSGIPIPVMGLSDAVQLTAGSAHTCARRETRAVVCWGSSQSGQIGHGTLEDALAPVEVIPP